MLGDIIQHVSGMKYGDFLRNQILAPLGMTHCSVGIAPGLEAYAAERYSAEDGSPADWGANEPSGQEAASSVFCSAHDLVRFGMFHLKEGVFEQKVVLSPSAIDEMQNSAVLADEGLHSGFGWWHEQRFGYKVMYASGGHSYASALLFTVPSEKIVAVVLINSGQGIAQEVADEVVSSLLPGYRENRDKAAHRQQQPSGAEFRDGQLRAKISGTSGMYERDPKKALDLDLQLLLRPSGVLNGGAATVPLSQPEWGVVTYSVQLSTTKTGERGTKSPYKFPDRNGIRRLPPNHEDARSLARETLGGRLFLPSVGGATLGSEQSATNVVESTCRGL